MVTVRFNPWYFIPIAVLIGVLMTVQYRQSVPTREDWSGATRLIRDQLQSGDGVTWMPYSMGEGRLFFHGLPAFHMGPPETADFSRYRRVWVLAGFGYDAEQINVPHTQLEAWDFGALTLSLLEISGERVTADLYTELESSFVQEKRGKTWRDCSFWDGRGWQCRALRAERVDQCLNGSTNARRRMSRFRRGYGTDCGLNRWRLTQHMKDRQWSGLGFDALRYVGRDVRVIGRLPRQCIWFRPDQRSPMRIRWTPKVLGDNLVIDYGWTDKVVRDHAMPENRTQPAILRVISNDSEVTQRVIEPKPGWHRWQIDWSGQSEVIFEITTENSQDAHFCFDPTFRANEGAQP